MAGSGRFVDINRATAEQLEKLSGVGRTRADAIVEFRDALGGFDSIDDLKQVPGIGPNFIEMHKDELQCSTKTPTSKRETRGSVKCKTGRGLFSMRRQTPSPVHNSPKPLSGSQRKHKLAGKPDQGKEQSPEKKFCTSKPNRLLKILPQRNYGTIKTVSTVLSPVEGRSRHSSLCGNPPAGLEDWLRTFQQWSAEERKYALDEVIETCEPSLVRHMMGTIEPRFQRDFISLLPKELALYVLSFLEPKDLLRAAQTCKCWQLLCEDNL